jgi:hypothetical protein
MIHSFGDFVNHSSDDEQLDFFTENKRDFFWRDWIGSRKCQGTVKGFLARVHKIRGNETCTCGGLFRQATFIVNLLGIYLGVTFMPSFTIDKT